MKVMFETHRRFIEMLGEQAVHFAAAAEATRGDGGRDLAAFVRAYDAARAINVDLDAAMEQLGSWSRDARKVSRSLMDEMVDWVIHLHHELDLVDYYDLKVPEDLGIDRPARVAVDADADALLQLGNAAAMFAWCWIDHLLLRTHPGAHDREGRFKQFDWKYEEFQKEYGVIRRRVEAGDIAADSGVDVTAKYLANSAEALRSDVINMSELPAGARV